MTPPETSQRKAAWPLRQTTDTRTQVWQWAWCVDVLFNNHAGVQPRASFFKASLREPSPRGPQPKVSRAQQAQKDSQANRRVYFSLSMVNRNCIVISKRLGKGWSKCLSKWECWTVSHLTNTVCLEAKSLNPGWKCRDEWCTPQQACGSSIRAPPCLELPQRLTAEQKVSVFHQLYTQNYGISQARPKHQMYLFKGTKICKHMWWSKQHVGALRINSILKFE